MANEYVNKVVTTDKDGVETVQIDLTSDLIKPEYVLQTFQKDDNGMIMPYSTQFHDATGAIRNGMIEDNAQSGMVFSYTNEENSIMTANQESPAVEGGRPHITLKNPKSFTLRGAYVGSADGLDVTVESSGKATLTLEDNDAGGQTLTIG